MSGMAWRPVSHGVSLKGVFHCSKSAKLSSIGNWGYQGNFKPVFFYEKISRKNTHKQKPTKKTKISEQKTTKATVFCAHNSKRVKVACLCV